MNYLALFVAGVLLCNSLPHLSNGLSGRPFPTPFAKPPGVGDSSALINFLWGAVNLFIGLYLISLYSRVIKLPGNFGTLLLGVLVMGVFTSVRFGQVMRTRASSYTPR